MIDLQNVLKEWEKDCVIDDMNLDEESRRAASLHAKYIQLHSLAKLQLKKSEMEQKVLLKEKWLYYGGKMDAAAIEDRGWEYDPFDGLKILKTDMDKYYDADPDIQKSEEKIEYWKVTVDTLKEILDSVKWRHQTIKNMIEWRKFQAGA